MAVLPDEVGPIAGVFITRGRRRGAIQLSLKTTGNFSPYTVQSGDDIIAVTQTPARITLPVSPQLGDEYEVQDSAGDAATLPIVVSGNGHMINGAPTWTIDSDYGSTLFTFNGTEWAARDLGTG